MRGYLIGTGMDEMGRGRRRREEMGLWEVNGGGKLG